MNIEGIIIGSAFMLLVGNVIFLIITDLPRRLCLLAKGLLIFGAIMMVLPVIGSYYFSESRVHEMGRVLSYISFHLGIMTIIYGKIFIRFKDASSKWIPMNNQPLFVYMITYLVIQIIGYSLNIDVLKEVIITESTTQSTPIGIPFLLSLTAGSLALVLQNRNKII